MAQAIAVVVSVTGRAFARDVKGNLRPLKAGDSLQEGEVVITMAGGQVELAMADGSPMAIAADQIVALTGDVSTTTRPEQAEAQVGQGTVDQVIQALEQGGTLDDLEAPAAGLAGGGGGGEGNNFVRLLRITESVSPLEFQYAQEPSALLEPEESGPIVEEEEPINFQPTISATGVTLDETGGLDSISGSLGAAFGGDVPGTITLSAPGATWNPATQTLTADNGTWQLVVNGDGTYTVTQLLAISHADANDPNDPFDVTVTATATDSNGDTATTTFVVSFLDDGPSIDTNPGVQLDDDALAGGNAGGTGDDVDSANTSGTLAHSFGTDGAGSIAWLTTGAPAGFTYSLNGTDLEVFQGATKVLTLTVNASTGAYTITQNAAILHPTGENENNVEFTFGYRVTDADGDFVDGSLSVNVDDDTPTVGSNATVQLDDDALAGGNPGGTGDDANAVNTSGTLTHSFGADGAGSIAWLTTGAPAGFTYSLNGTDLEVFQGATKVLTLTVNATTGAYTVTQNAAILHPTGENENNVEFTFGYRVTDADGDFVDGSLSVNVDDDTPTVGSNATVQLDDDALAGGNPGGTGDDANGVNTSGTLTHSFGADGAGSIAWLTTGAPAGFTYSLNGTDLEVFQGATKVLTLTVNATTGAYTVTQNAAILHPTGENENNVEFTFGYRVTDADGDFVDGSLSVNVDDDTPTVGSNATVQLDDDALAGGNPGGTGDDANAVNTSGTLTHSFGADGAGAIAWLTTGAPAGFTYSLNGTDLEVFQGATKVLTLTVNATTGAYTVTQNAAILHPTGENENNVEFTFGYRVTDADGDFVDGSLSVNVDDDTPTVGSNATVQLDDDALAGGNPGGTGDDANSVNTSGTLTHSFGADGAGSIAWLTTGAPAGFSYEASGTSLLVKQGTTTVLTLTLNTTTGAYTVTQNAPIMHTAGGDENNVVFSIGYRVTDADGDFVDGSLSVNVDDDTPTVGSNATVQLDDDALAGGNPGGTGDDPNAVNTSGTLTHSFGADGAGSIAWLTTGAPAGFSYEASGTSLLVKQGTTTVLTLTLNTATGAYTVTQNAPIMHTAGGDENNIVFNIGYRVTDADGDFVDGSLSVNVDDDTPTVGSNATVQLDDDALAGGNPGGTGDDANAVNTSGTLTHSFGADGAGSIAWLTTGAPTGFSYEASGTSLLVKQGTTTVLTLTLNTATGAYTVTQNAPIMHTAGGDENNIVFSIGYRVTDADGDSVDGTLSVDVDDDTPTAAIAVKSTASLVVDETAGVNTPDDAAPVGTLGQATISAASLFTNSSTFGADGAASSGATIYSLVFDSGNTATGLADTLSGQAILLVNNAGVIEGRTATGNQLVFTISIDATTGSVTLTQYRAVVHNDPADPDESGASAAFLTGSSLALRVTVTDADGDHSSANASLNGVIAFEDDGPKAFVPEAGALMNEGGTSFIGALDLDSNIVNNYGSDGGSIRFASSLAGATSLTSGGLPITYAISGSGLILTASTEAGTVFTVTLNPTTGEYQVTMISSVDGGAGTIDFNDGGYNFVGGNGNWAGFLDPGDNNSSDLLITPMIKVNGVYVSGGTVNTNANEGGIGSGNSVGAGEAMRIDFVTDLGGTPKNGLSYDPADPNHFFDSHYTVNGASALFTAITGGTAKSVVLIRAYDDNDSDNVVGNGIQDSITAVAIKYNGQTKIVSVNTAGTTPYKVTVGDVEFTVLFTNHEGTEAVDYEVQVSGVVSNTQIAVYTADGFNSVEYQYVSGSTFKIGDFGASELTQGEPKYLNFPLEITDGDGDTVSAHLSLTLMPDDLTTQDFSGAGSGVTATSTTASPHIIGSASGDTLNGNAGANVLYGGDGDDTLSGGAGNDMLIGGLGADTFKWTLGDQGTTSTPAMDTIKDFLPAQGDKLDIKDLLQGDTPGTISQFLQMGVEGGKVVLSIDHNGGGAFEATQKIVFDNYSSLESLGSDLGLTGTITGQSIIDDLITKGKLITD